MAAIEFAQYLCAKLKELEAQWNEPAHRHPHYAHHDHPINFNIGKLSGGEWASSVATQCRADVRIGFYPGMKPAQVRALVEAVVKAAYEAHPKKASVRYELIYEGFQAEGMLVDMNQPMIDTLKACHHEVAGGQMALIASTATTDARFFQLYGGIPATCYGPQSGNTHGIDEWVSIDSMMEVSAGAGAVHGALVRAERALIRTGAQDRIAPPAEVRRRRQRATAAGSACRPAQSQPSSPGMALRGKRSRHGARHHLWRAQARQLAAASAAQRAA